MFFMLYDIKSYSSESLIDEWATVLLVMLRNKTNGFSRVFFF